MKRKILLLLLNFCLLLPVITEGSSYTEDSTLYYGTFSDNYIIRWGYQGICHHVHDTGQHAWMTTKEGVVVDPTKVKPGDLIFVRNIEQFFKDIMPKISCPFILVTAGDCIQAVHEKYFKYLADKNLIHWFAIHPCKTPHPKITPIPLGILQKFNNYKNRVEQTKLFAELRNKPKEKLLYMNFSGATKPPIKADRRQLYNMFKDKAFCYAAPFCTGGPALKYIPYMKEMATFKFAFSPEGKGIDCYRTWEALLVGTIPIVKTSQVDPLLADLPVLIVDTWEKITEQFLEEKYEEMRKKRYNIEKLCIEYWATKILAMRTSFLASQNLL